MSTHISALQQSLQKLQQLTSSDVFEIESVQVELHKVEVQLQHLDMSGCSSEQLGNFLLELQRWLEQSQHKLLHEKQLLAESLRSVQKGRAGTQVYQTNR